ncbi:MAG TPA: rRNA adenine dimethyltransferase family protein, partial [Blastocatellia bacterium]|nr:rRNA adenine dimethyltransferase family protein [Blastocatellia bacterium]
IIQLLLGHSSKLYDMTLMLQDEVVDRIAAAPTGKEYGYLSVLVQYYCEIKKLFKVPPSAFTPAPKVWSAVVRLSTRERPIVEVADEAAFFGLVRACFAQRRKTLLNNLKAAQATLGFGHDVDSIESALSRAGIDPRRRAETLTIGDFALLYDALFARAG